MLSVSPTHFDEGFWNSLMGSLFHELQLLIIETIAWIDQPVSPVQLEKIFEGRYPLSNISYHTRRLQALGVIEVVEEEPVRGSVQHFYYFADRSPQPR
jgi:hypothetical protein